MAAALDVGFVTSVWQQLVAVWPYSDRMLFTVGTYLALTGTNLMCNGILAMAYHYGWWQKYRIQKAKWPEWPIVKECLIHTVFIGAVLLRPFIIYLIYPLFRRWGVHSEGELPSLLTVAWQFLVCMALNNTLFYWCHRALHHKSVYKYVHKYHHTFKATIGIAAEHAHPVEQVLANGIPTLIGPVVCQMHYAAFWAWLIFRELETVDAHCGFELPFSPFSLFPWQGGADRHDFHHSHWNKGNYGGAFAHFWDWLCGTDKDYWAWKEAQKKAKQEAKAE